jgi:PEP-CTERM motif-containing protein
MKLNTTLVLIALAFAGSAASAATVGQFTTLDNMVASDNPTVGPVGAAAHGNFQAAAPIDDVYNFNIAADSDLFTYAKEFESLDVSMAPANFTLYSGTSTGDSGTTATMIGTTFSFAGGDAVTTTYSDLKAGNYFFEITGAAAGVLGADYDLNINANTPGGPLPGVPEPANMALMLAGLGLMGFMVKRRARD